MRIEELNLSDKGEIMDCQDTGKSSTGSEKEDEKMDIVRVVTVPSPPATSYQFYADWRHLERHPLERTQYLLSMGPQVIKEIFKHSLEADVLSDIIVLLYNAVTERGCRGDGINDVRRNAVALLEALTHVGRFDTLVMFIDEEETCKLQQILEGEPNIKKLWNLQ